MSGRTARTACAVGTITVLALLSGCATAGGADSATIAYEVDGRQKTASFTPQNVHCNDWGAVSLSFPHKPYNSISLTRGSTDKVTAWVYDDEQLTVFTADDLTVTETTDDGTTEYVISGQQGQVAVTRLTRASPGIPPDVDAAIKDADRHTGTLDVRLRCDPG